MGKPVTKIVLKTFEREQLEQILREPKAQRRFSDRARIVLWANEGLSNRVIAERLDVRAATVSKWRVRFEQEGLAGLHDDFRAGRPVKYEPAELRPRILAQLDEAPPSGYARWNGPLLAKELGVSADRVWAELRSLGIHLERRRSWCVSTDPQFAPKAADIVGLYLSPPDNAVVLCVDEKPAIQALERHQGWLRLPNGKAITGFNHEYKRNGTINLFAALNVATGQIQASTYKRKRRAEFLDFMDQLVAAHPGKELHVILDNYSSHKIEKESWALKHSHVHLHFTPTHASWLNQIEIWFGILTRQALRGANFSSVKHLIEAIEKFIQAYNPTACPFEWTKVNVTSKTFESKYANLSK